MVLLSTNQVRILSIYYKYANMIYEQRLQLKFVVGETMQTNEKFEKYVNIWYSRDSTVISLHNSFMRPNNDWQVF